MTFIEDIKKPSYFISLFIGIIGIGLSIYFYNNGKRTKGLSYNIEASSLIYDSKNASSSIKVVAKDSIPIKDNVYLLTGVMWNSGNVPIEIQDVRKKISIRLTSAIRILDFKIVKETDPGISEFRLTKDKNESLALSWRYFDPGYAFKFQIIYTGKESSNFDIDGKILDINNFNEVITGTNKLSATGLGSLGILITISILNILLKRKTKSKWGIFDLVIIIIMPLAAVILFVLLFFNSNTTVPLI